jgi:hypothetical protein
MCSLTALHMVFLFFIRYETEITRYLKNARSLSHESRIKYLFANRPYLTIGVGHVENIGLSRLTFIKESSEEWVL